MLDLFAVSVGAAGSLVGYLVYDRVTGCRGGHVWGEWEDEDRWQVLPWETPTKGVTVQRQQRRVCQRSNCRAEETEWQWVHKNADTDVVEEALGDI